MVCFLSSLKKIDIQPFETPHVTGLCTVPVTTKWLNVIIEAGEEPFSDSVTTVNSYSHIKQGTNRVPLGLHNFTCRVVTIPTKTVVAKISAASVVLHRLAPNLKEGGDAEIEQNPMEPEKLKPLFEKLDLSGITDWSSEQQQEVKDLITKYHSLFTVDDLDLSCNSVVKHSIKLTDETPYKECY